MLRLLAAIVVGLLSCGSTVTLPGAPPVSGSDESAAALPVDNVLVVILDDWGRAITPGYPVQTGVSKIAQADALARIAADGVQFNNAWVHPSCAPTRFSFTSGVRPVRHGATKTAPGWDLQTNIENNLYRLAKDSGRYTFHSGKYGVSDYGRSGMPGWPGFPGSPAKLGVDHQEGSWSNLGDLFVEQEFDDWRRFVNGVADASNITTGTDPNNYATIHAVDVAIAQMGVAAGQGRSFFGVVGFQGIHTPLHTPPTATLYSTPTGSETDAELLLLMAESVDFQLDRLLDSVPANTTIMVFGDNGSTSLGTASPLGKSSVYEGGVGVPLYISGHLVDASVKGTTVDALTTTEDLYATAADFLGFRSRAESTGDDAISLRSCVTAQGCSGERSIAFSEHRVNAFFPTIFSWEIGLRTDRYKLHVDASSGVAVPEFFFDLQTDPEEQTDLLGAIPPGAAQNAYDTMLALAQQRVLEPMFEGCFADTAILVDAAGNPDEDGIRWGCPPGDAPAAMNSPPTATITSADPTNIPVDSTQAFTSDVSDPDGNIPVTCVWDFDDSGVGDSTDCDTGAVGPFATPGSYTATLTPTDSLLLIGSSDTIAFNVVANNRPNGTINTASGTQITQGQTASFSGTCLDDEGDPLTHLWDFGASGVGDSTAEDPANVGPFATLGTYTVTYTCSDAGGPDPTPDTISIDVVVAIAACTDGVDCPCDLHSDGSTLFCDDFENPAYYSDVTGAWYESPGGNPGFRGGAAAWQSTYGPTSTSCNWTLGEPASPTLGNTCGFASCGAKEWRADDLWQGNNFACIDIQRVGEQDDEIAGLTFTPAASDPGQQHMAWRIQPGRTSDFMGSISLGGITEMGITQLLGYSSNLSTAVDPSHWDGDFVTGPWKHAEFQPSESTIFLGNVNGSSPPFAVGMFGGTDEAGCNTAIASANNIVGSIRCIAGGGGNFTFDSPFDRSTDWPDLSEMKCVTGHISGLGTSSGTYQVTFDGTTIIHVTNIDWATIYADSSITAYRPNPYFNDNQGLPGDIPSTETLYRYEDNVFIQNGPPLDCSVTGG